MAEYIERGAILDRLRKVHMDEGPFTSGVQFGVEHAIQCIEEAAAADVAPVVHGHWIDKPTGRYGEMQSWCTSCGKRSGIGGIKKNRHKPYCPNCGAKMDGERSTD